MAAASTIGGLELYPEPSFDRSAFAYLAPGIYAGVLEQGADDWCRIETTDADLYQPDTDLPASGWITEISGIEFFGPCDR